MKHLCPVCGKHNFSEYDSYEYCPECGWQDDGFQESEPDFEGGANDMSLLQAKEAYKKGLPIE